MTSQRLRELRSKGAASIRPTLSGAMKPPPRYHGLGLHISQDHPEDGGILIQCEMDSEEQRAIERRFHCFSLSENELAAFIKAAKSAMRLSKKTRAEYLRSTESVDPENDKPTSNETSVEAKTCSRISSGGTSNE